ncbi:cytochrome B [Larkinella terrae]|uniref:Cytochrome B n=1 Tax=Larkinella terrae TaxID=2025311 RepID=A0A7K0ELK1_9BACT|nr:cytochrome B [Larkinella terrae]MRS62318.1 cytochrome B [Larkinella terrae]
MLYNILVHTHSGLRWIVLILLLAAIVTAFRKWQGRDEYTPGNNKLYLFALIATHTQFTIGLILYFLSPKVPLFDGIDFGTIMKTAIYRFYSVEHIVGMLIAVVLITIGRSKSRRISGPVQKHRTVFMFYGLGLLAILISIPWPFRIPGAGWF